MRCTKAIIAVGGFGTRRLPITKAIEKCMLPIGNRPLIDYIVDDCLQAGITDIIFITGEQSSQLRAFYSPNQLLEDYLARLHKTKELEAVSQLSVKARFQFVTQDQNQPYGTSVPLWLTRHYIAPNEPFLFLYGDAIFFQGDGSAIQDFLQAAHATRQTTALLTTPVPASEVSKYGIVATKQQGDVQLFDFIVEKPDPKDAPSNLNNAGCFLLNPTIFPFVERSMQANGKEQFFTDALNWFHEAGNEIAVITSKAEFLDCGNVDGWLHANNRILEASS